MKPTRILSWILAVLSLVVFNEVAVAQTGLQSIGAYSYAQYNGVWYTVIDGRKGDRVDTAHLIVRLKDRSSIDPFDFSTADLPKLKNTRGEFAGGFYELEIPSNLNGFDVGRKLVQTNAFDQVFFNLFLDMDENPNDPHYSGQWNLPRISMASGWDVSTGVNSIIVAVIDVGADYNHEDLYGSRWSGIGYDFYDNDPDPYPSDEARHGTAVAGIIGAVTNNWVGVSGVAGGWDWNGGIRLMHLDAGYRWWDPQAQRWRESISISAAAQATSYAAQQGARVVNMSFGGASQLPALESAINNAVNNHGVVVVASAGNYESGQSTAVGYPAAYANVIPVGATIPADQRKNPSDGTGETWGSCYGPELDIAAPGVFIWTTDLTGSIGYTTGNYYDRFNGTSSAAPHVAGLAALIRSINPSLTPQQVRQYIQNSADKVGGYNYNWNQSMPGHSQELGYGRINASNTLGQVFRNQTITVSSYQPTPGGILLNTNTLGGTVSYIGNKSSSSGGPFYWHGSTPSTPIWMGLGFFDIINNVYRVDTSLYYWTVHGWNSTAGTTAPSSVNGPVAAWHLKSASAVATKNNNQRKIAKGNWQHHVMVFESGGDIFFTRSTNNGTTWLPEELVSVGNGLNANPAIEHLVYIVSPNSYNESYVVWEENPVGANGYRIWSRRRDNNQNTWDPIRLLHEDISNRPVAAQPVVSGFYTFWRGPNGLLWRYSGPSNFPTVYTLPGTDANSNAPSVEVTTFYGGTAHVAWEQAGAGIRYARGTVDINGGTWNPVISVANSSGLTTNAKPTVAENFSGNACIAWEYKFISTGSIKFRTVAPNGAMSSVTTFPNPPGSTRIPTSASLSSYRSSYTDDLTVTWHSPADGVIALYYRSGAWQSPFVVSPAAQHAHVNNTYVSSDNTRLAMFMGTSGSPYRVFTSALPSSTPAPRSPVLLSPANGATGVPVPATVAWDYVIGASTYRLQIDDNSDFSSPVLDVSGLTGTNHYASLNTWTTYYWRVNATSPYGTSAWSSVWSFTTGDPLPPSCPFVFTWNGEEFVEDNNILPQSLDPENAGVDVLDVYRLMKPPVARDGKYLMQIREDAEDYSRFDNFTLIAVDHPTAIEVAMKDEGTVIPYIKPFNLHRARYRDRDVLRELIAFDSLVVNTRPGDIVDFGFKRFSGGAGIKADFGDPFGEANSSTGAEDEGGIEAGGSGEDQVTDAIGRPLLFSFNGGQTSMTQTQGAYFRHNPSLVYIPFTLFDTTNVQLAWSSSVNLDYLNLAMKVSARVATRELPLQKAIHNVAGDVTEQLASLDGLYAELAQGQSIELTFTARTVPAGMKRTFFLVSTGRYEHLQGSPGNQLSQVSSSPSFAGVPTEYQLHQNHPNPFNPTTVIRFDLPIDGHVTLEVYDVLGRQVLTLLDDHRLAGYHQTVFDARGLSSGTYFYRLQAGDYVSVKKLLLLR
jgi:subtilisin family serine protease